MAADEHLDDPVPAGDFARDTEVWPDTEIAGRFRADLPEAWKVFYAFGGATTAVALRAAHRSLGRDDLRPVSATAMFAAPVPCGPLTIDTVVVRNGRTIAQATADLRCGSDADTAVHLAAVFGKDHESHVHFNDAVWPDDALAVDVCADPMPPPEDSPFHRINYHDQTEFRPAASDVALFGGEWQPGPARSLTWHRLVKEPRLADGTIDPISLCAPADILGPAIWSRMGPPRDGNPFFLVLSLEINVQFIAPTTSAWILQHTRVPVAADGYGFSYVELWDTEHQLVAIATQRCNVRPVSPERFAQPDGTA